jgi:molybdate transport system substrate-binding protein
LEEQLVRSILVRALAISLLAAACTHPGRSTAPGSPAGSGAPASAAPMSHTLTILAAASLKAALDEAKAAYEAANPGTTLVITTDSSAALEAQLEQGAYADVFLSADAANPQKLVDGGFAEGESKVFAGNRLTIVVPTDNPGGIESWADLVKGGLKVIAAGEAVPITKYATQLIDNLAAQPDAPAGFAAAYAANIVSREENVKALIAKIELGEGGAGIVYVTDAAASTKVETVDVPEAANVPATYAGVVLKASDDILRAEGFLDWFAGPDGQAILAPHGFLPPPE